MMNHYLALRRVAIGSALALALFAGATAAAEPASSPALRPSPAELAASIDRHIAAEWQAVGVASAAPSDDAEFLRRVSLDLTGNIPTVARAREFLADESTGKRGRLIQELLDSPGYVRHFTSVWRAEWLQQPDAPQNAALTPGFDSWLRSQLRRNAGYDALVREVLRPEDAAPAERSFGTPSLPGAFLQAVERSPESQAGVTARLFLGLNVDCAQCHNHPFARWKKEQFWNYAALFAPPSVSADGAARLELAIPGDDALARPAFLDGSQPLLPEKVQAGDGRAAVAAWIASRENPYFARNAVNRLWARFFGAGLIEPLDDQSGQVPASHPELLDELATTFAESGFDLRFLIESVALSKTYQLSSIAPPGAELSLGPESRLFTHAAVRIMDGEQLYDSLLRAVGASDEPEERAQFVAAFGRPDRPAETQRTILQVSQLMNGDFVGEAVALDRSRTLRAVAGAPFLDDDAKLDVLFLAALSRFPAEQERSRIAARFASNADGGDRRHALAEVFWVLLNSNEFGTIH